MSKKLFLLDALALICRARFARVAWPIFTSKGVNTSALFAKKGVTGGAPKAASWRDARTGFPDKQVGWIFWEGLATVASFMSEPSISNPVLLAADDDENAHLLLRHALKKAGVSVRLETVNDGEEAIQYLRGEGRFADRAAHPFPRVLLLDWKMPRCSGAEVLERIKREPFAESLTVIVFSSSSVQMDAEAAYQLGCYAYVVKPANFEQLIEIARVLHTDFLTAPEGFRPKLKHSRISAFCVSRPEPHRVMEPMPDHPDPTPASSDVFRLLVEQVKDYAIFILDEKGFIRSWNDGARRIKGYEAHEVIGRHFSIFYPEKDRDNERPQHELRVAREMGRFEEENWRVRKDGSRFWANVVVTPLRDGAGKFSGFAKVTRDLTQRKLQEENIQRLLDSEERFRLLVDQVKDYAIFMLDAKGNIASWNQGARRLKGYTAEEILGKHFSIFYTPDDQAREHPAKELSIAIRDGRYEEEGWRVRKDGTRFWANVVITALWDKRGNLTGFAKVTRDLTARKEKDDALRRKTADLESFAHTLSHDLRAPLRSISSFAQILAAEGSSLNESDRGYLQKIVRASQSMDAMITDVLKLSELSNLPHSEIPVSVEGAIQEALFRHEAEIRAAGAVVEFRRPLPHVIGNGTLLVQIFSNLLSNALKFVAADRRPRVEIWPEETEEGIEVHLKDNGVGIPARFQPAIFNLFERGAAGAEFPGTGVGLAIVRRAAEKLGGSIGLVSKEGEGSDFILKLPHTSAALPK